MASKLARSLRQEREPIDETVDNSVRQPRNISLGAGAEQDEDGDEGVSTEDLLRVAVQRKGLTGSVAVSGMSQLLEILDTLGEKQNVTDKEPQMRSDSSGLLEESGDDRSSCRGREAPKKIDVIGTNSFTALLRGRDIIPHALMEALSNDQFLPLSLFLSAELARRNTTNT